MPKATKYKWYKVKIRRPYSKEQSWVTHHVQARTKKEAVQSFKDRGYVIVSVTT